MFNLYVEDFPDPGEVLVHNTLSGAYVVLPRELLSTLEQRAGGPSLEGPETARNETLATLDELSDPDIGVVVADREQEERAYRDWFEGQRALPDMKAIVAVNRACNFACSYCCQADVMDGSVMTPAVADASAAWLAARAIAVGAQRLHVTFVGGEPLLHPDRIVALASRLRALLDQGGEGRGDGGGNGRAIALTIGLITNGLFLDEEMVRRLEPHGLTIAQVTLDGDERTHSRSRISKRGEPTFARIFANVIAASRRIRIALNGNYQRDTIAGFAPLIRDLAAADFGREHGISFTPALASLGAPAGSGSGQCTWSRSDHGYRVALQDELLRHGYRPLDLHVIGPCSFHQHHMYVVDVDGAILKCPGFLGHAEWAIGHVASGLTGRYRELLSIDTASTCGGCAHRPNCAGGCVAHALLRGGEPGAPYDPSLADHHCEFDYLQTAATQGLPRAYLMSTAGSVDDAMAAFPAPPVTLPTHGPDDGPISSTNVAPRRGRRSVSLPVMR
ncbi:MAG TPA: radical SAM protein [Haliangium sp.]|nr:radical SAM protein [Haliangium sp.]